MEKYRNKRAMLRRSGKFAKHPTLEQLGFDVAKSKKHCKCGHVWQPILKSGYCPACGSADGILQEAQND